MKNNLDNWTDKKLIRLTGYRLLSFLMTRHKLDTLEALDFLAQREFDLKELIYEFKVAVNYLKSSGNLGVYRKLYESDNPQANEIAHRYHYYRAKAYLDYAKSLYYQKGSKGFIKF